jgi:hypothetical protein
MRIKRRGENLRRLSGQFGFVGIILLSALIFSSATSCAKKAPDVREDVSVDDLDSAVGAVFDTQSLMEMDEAYVTSRVGIDSDVLEAYVLRAPYLGTNVDEYGIFKSSSQDSAREVSDIIDTYLQSRRDSWLDECQDPEQKPKITNAASKSIGAYVVYVIAAEETQKSAFDAFEKALTK